MTPSALVPPSHDPTAIFEIYRGSFGTELLTSAVAHLHVFEHFSSGPVEKEVLRKQLGLADRPFIVLLTALRAFGLIVADAEQLDLTPMACEHLLPDGPFYVGDYVGLAAESPGVLAMVKRLKTNRPAGSEGERDGVAFIYREGIDSAMEHEQQARNLTLALAGRAKNVAPVLADRVDLGTAELLLDVGGGTGIYSIAFLRKYPKLCAIIWDRPEVLKVAEEMARSYSVLDRLELRPGNMFADAIHDRPDVILLSNILHDWDVPDCQELVHRCASILRPCGRLLVHDVFLRDALDGPLAIALYSASLFCVTEGRAYSAAEYRGWLQSAGLRAGDLVPTLIHCGVLTGYKA